MNKFKYTICQVLCFNFICYWCRASVKIYNYIVLQHPFCRKIHI